MKITITFEAGPDDDPQLRQLDGKTVTMDGASILKLSTAVDTIADGEGGKLPLHTGSLTLNARGNRAMWAESSEPTLKP